MGLIWGGLVGVPEKNAEGLTTCKAGSMVCALTTAGEAVCMLVAEPVEWRPEAVEGCCTVCCDES